MKTVHLGFEIPTGEPVEIPLAHLCVTGQTQLSGKTTTLEALVSRSGLKAVAFVTKRGESTFIHNTSGGAYEYIAPYFRHRADWQFVSDILGAILSEKLKFQRPWIMKVCRGARSLEDVHANVRRALTGDKQKKIRAATGLAESVFTELDAYFDLLLPELERLPYSETLTLEPGLNIMDLSTYSTPLQMLVVSSVLEEIYKKHTDVITVIPEAWEFVPNNKSSPAKSAAINLIRKGAVLRNFIWLDSQDLASIDTEVRRAVGVWILGVQREQNEVKRVLSHIPAGTKRPKLEDVMHLELGKFFVCHQREVKKVYAQPAWMDPAHARCVAKGEMAAGSVPVRVDFPPLSQGQHWELGVASLSTPEQRRAAMHDVIPGDTIIDPPALLPQTMPLGLNHDIDNPVPDGEVHFYRLDNIKTPAYEPLMPLSIEPDTRPQSVIDAERKEIERMDQQEREGYESTISQYRARIKELERQIRVFGNSSNAPATGTGISGAPSSVTLSSEYVEQLINIISDRVLARMPRTGTIRVEPREVVLKQFQEREVERILEAAQLFPPFSKAVIAFLEARGQGVKKANAVTAVTGKKFANMARDCKEDYEEMRELAAAGWIREDTKNSVVFPNLGVIIKKRVEAFNPSDEDVENIIGQVMLKLK